MMHPDHEDHPGPAHPLILGEDLCAEVLKGKSPLQAGFPRRRAEKEVGGGEAALRISPWGGGKEIEAEGDFETVTVGAHPIPERAPEKVDPKESGQED